jgi:hypothetical protein
MSIGLTRRSLLWGWALGAVGVLVGARWVKGRPIGVDRADNAGRQRLVKTFRRRVAVARARTSGQTPDHSTNGDEQRRGLGVTFGKALPRSCQRSSLLTARATRARS